MNNPTVKIPRVVVRHETNLRRWLLLALIPGALLLWGAFEWGRGNLGLPGGITPDRVTLRERVSYLEDELRTVRVALAQRESDRVGQLSERNELARTISSLRADVQRLESELGFYRGVVGDNAQVDAVKVQQFRVARTAEAGVYRMRLVLGRPINRDGNISGKLRITIEGAPGSDPATLDLAQAADVAAGELTFDFRYLEEVEQIVRLPPRFTPARTVVELIPARKGVNPVRETFPWAEEN
ncbi:MAG: hypothetical protein M3Y79_09840 [Pseudomonadota bacterium]|nr:hypothetical protein [Pseudomonadota bacterium]